ncbi:MAG: FAD-dependent oxidoreductase [Christensenellaceae bacterium]|jgi:2,4-dienoyl-CoA reductase-like NADH-dependent reductase (Old Yellow Enzyme family)/thioredoxin reductase
MFSELFSPLKIGSVTIKNRLMVPAMVTNLSTDKGMCTEAFVAYHEAKAKGGWGLIVTENCAVAPEGRGYRLIPGLWTDAQRDSIGAIPQAVHKYDGAKIFAQIYHCGRQTTPAINGGYQPVAPSAIPCPSCGVMPRELALPEIETLVKKFGDAAERAKQAGFDGIEIHGGHGYLIAQFMSPYSNKRVDRYGGNLQNRMRFPLEVIEEVRKRVGKEYPVGFRISAEEQMPGSRELEDTLVISKMLESCGIDIIHVSVGTYGTPVVVAPMQYAHGWIVPLGEKVKQAVDIPVITVNRITDPFMANQIVEMGRADVVAMGRASLADPELPNKAKAGTPEEIRQCIGCIVCDHTTDCDKSVRCSVNPTLAYEYEGPIQKTKSPKKIFIAGAGPAGLEAARAAAVKGHDVYLFEKDSQPGGAFRAAPYPPYKGELATVVSWLWQQCEKLGVTIYLNTELTQGRIAKDKPDKVIVATGAKPVMPPIPGIDKGHVFTAYDALMGHVETGQTVIVAGGGSVGVETACHLGLQNKRVCIVEMLPEFAADEDIRIREQFYMLMEKLKIEMLPLTRIAEITEKGAILENKGECYFKPAEHIVAAFGYRGDDCFYKAACEVCGNVELIGDAGKAGKLVDVMRAGYLAGSRA